ncbi:MAG: thioredoxin domain-containing protein [Solirubrobacterales bacterium]|nr:thioredoxin domain-containing protein [Solirubrobacterales bacterium]
MANALAHETSPYLQQHRDNPVDWLPWGEQALRRAREEDKPLLVSIGYSACHWCHVMERESFEDPETAALMNEHFVCVKVDREERPDVDAIYMEAVQAMTGHGGWPLNVFATPEQVPFYGGTYFPPAPRHGMPAWRAVLAAVAETWATRRDEIRAQGDRMAERLSLSAALRPTGRDLDAAVLDDAVRNLRASFDTEWAGFGGAPKFPPSSALLFLLDRAARGGDWAQAAGEMALATLRAMASGGIHDQVGGGFARYAVDRTWTVPHFEKMLYDNALLARAYLRGFQLSGDAELRAVCEDVLAFAARELRGSEGGFLCALDADSEGVEGRFYVWTVAELRDVLGDDAGAAIAWFGATEAGNFEGANVLEGRGPRPPAEQRERIRAALLEARARRVRPGLDDKRLTAWNGLMIQAFAEAGAVLGREDLLAVARDAAGFVLAELRDERGRLLRTWKDGRARLNGYLEDHAFLLEALLALYEATFEPRWFAAARETADAILEHFADPAHGGFFATSDDHEHLVVRRKDLEDHPIPSGSSSAALGLLRLAALTGDARYEEAAASHLRLVGDLLGRHPQAFAHALQALDHLLATPREVALAGDPEGVAALAAVVREELRPGLVLAGPPGDGVPLMEGRQPVGGRAAAYVCERFACRMPVTEPSQVRELLAHPRS